MELTKEQTLKLIELAGLNLNPDELNSAMISRLLVSIEQRLNTFSCPRELQYSKNLRLLIVDDLELSIFQLTKVLEKIGVSPSVARDKKTAVAEIKKNKFDYLVVDLYLPDLADGIDLIEQAIALRKTGEQNFKIFAISSTNDAQIIDKCNCLADYFVPKSQNWHEEILRLIAIDVNNDKHGSNNFNKHIVDNDFIVYDLFKINAREFIDELIGDLKISLAMGSKNIVINFENIKFIDSQHSGLFAELYKVIANSSGKFVVLNPSTEIENTLEETFLSDIIRTTNSLSEAIKILQHVD